MPQQVPDHPHALGFEIPDVPDDRLSTESQRQKEKLQCQVVVAADESETLIPQARVHTHKRKDVLNQGNRMKDSSERYVKGNDLMLNVFLREPPRKKALTATENDGPEFATIKLLEHSKETDLGAANVTGRRNVENSSHAVQRCIVSGLR
jgi:hypothetical protein